MNNTTVGSTRSTNGTIITSQALELINISSCSGDEFTVEPISLPTLEDRFRIATTTLSDMSTAFMGAAGAAMFTRNNEIPSPILIRGKQPSTMI